MIRPFRISARSALRSQWNDGTASGRGGSTSSKLDARRVMRPPALASAARRDRPGTKTGFKVVW